METHVTFRNMDSSDSLREYATEKIQRLAKFFSLPVDAHVVLGRNKFHCIAEITLSGGGLVLHGEENTEDMHGSIDLAVEKLERQARKHKDRTREHRGIVTGTEQVMVRHGIVGPATEEKDEQGSRLVNVEEFDAKPMGVEEAMEQLKIENQDFFVFINSGSQEVNVIYRRHDGQIGLIEARTRQQ